MHVVVKTLSVMENVSEEDNGARVLKFKKWSLAQSAQGAKNSLQVILPRDSRIVSYFPQENSQKTNYSILWFEIPSEPISIKYRQQEKEN